MFDTDPPPTPAEVRAARSRVEDLRRQLAEAERALRHLLDAAGRRPGGGSDQPGLFDPPARPRLW